ncbi:hypothetical protein [Streptosporangium sp. NPDC002524]|uniref:Pepco domain-containing protein n=1 Tax=Streptosporangium sp. NPDC002524 TaxID=3154537 RepID=UPI00331FD208
MFDAAAEISPATLPFLVSIDDTDSAPASGGDMGIFSRESAEPSLRRIPIAVLQDSLRKTVGGLRELFDEIAESGGRMPLKQAQISFEVTASGGIALIGTSAQLAGKGAITLTFGE